MSFNPRSREGSDKSAAAELHIVMTFQSTLPRRERRKTVTPGIGAKGFNPRSREGSDIPSRAIKVVVSCFNPRSREGSDILRIEDRLIREVSIHAPAKGATR